MGLKNRNSTIYLNINKGKIVKRVPEGTEGATKRVLENGKTIYELHYDSFEGTLVGVKAREVEFADNKKSKVWELSLDDNGEKYLLSFPYSSGLASGFLRTIESADLNKPIEFRPSWYNEKNYIFLQQISPATGKMENLKINYSKENPNGLPQMKKLMVKGQEIWDDTEQLAFLQNIIDTKIVPNLPKSSPFLTPEEQAKESSAGTTKTRAQEIVQKKAEELPVEDSGDLPF